MQDFIIIGTAPIHERTAQPGDIAYYEQCMLEIQAYMTQLKRQIPEITKFKIKKVSFPHDFGTMHEIMIVFEESQKQEVYRIEENLPHFWDQEAKEFLISNNYYVNTRGIFPNLGDKSDATKRF
jgi:hypothetical protein